MNSYEQHMKAYLLSKGVAYKSHDEYLQLGEEGWQKQCEEVRAFQAHLDYWLAHQGLDVKVHIWANEVES